MAKSRLPSSRPSCCSPRARCNTSLESPAHLPCLPPQSHRQQLLQRVPHSSKLMLWFPNSITYTTLVPVHYMPQDAISHCELLTIDSGMASHQACAQTASEHLYFILKDFQRSHSGRSIRGAEMAVLAQQPIFPGSVWLPCDSP